jgi:hypothetical protein
MFISTRRSGYTLRGTQFAQGRFLILMVCSGKLSSGEACPCEGPRHSSGVLANEFRGSAGLSRVKAIVRYASLRQCGHFMMGSARIAGQRVTLSGAYGGDGLTRTVNHEVYAQGIDLPGRLYELWNTGGGWNGAGSEAGEMRAWALENFPQGVRR